MASRFVRRATLATELVLSGNFVTMLRNLTREDGSRVMCRRPLPKPWVEWSPRRINTLAEGLNARRYLEIGVFL